MKIIILKLNKIIGIFLVIFTISLIFLLTGKEKEFKVAVELKKNSCNIEEENKKVAYLTFDDGPSLSVTPKILEILRKEDVKATFFVVGKNVDRYPEIVKQEYEEGHYIANHGYSHNNKILYKNRESFIKEIKMTDEAIGRAVGVENYCSKIFRFPNGYMSKINKREKRIAVDILKELNYVYVDWNCLNNDSMKKYTKRQLLENLKKTSKNKEELIILMHDTNDVSDSSEALEDSIQYLKQEGYEFRNFYNSSM